MRAPNYPVEQTAGSHSLARGRSPVRSADNTIGPDHSSPERMVCEATDP
jgi:hypothetical protein